MTGGRRHGARHGEYGGSGPILGRVAGRRGGRVCAPRRHVGMTMAALPWWPLKGPSPLWWRLFGPGCLLFPMRGKETLGREGGAAPPLTRLGRGFPPWLGGGAWNPPLRGRRRRQCHRERVCRTADGLFEGGGRRHSLRDGRSARSRILGQCGQPRLLWRGSSPSGGAGRGRGDAPHSFRANSPSLSRRRRPPGLSSIFLPSPSPPTSPLFSTPPPFFPQDGPVKLAIVMKVVGRTGSRGQVIIMHAQS